MKKLFLLVGLPASGKSTFCESFKNSKNTVILSSDLIRKELFGNEECQKNNQLVFKTLHKRVEEALKNGKDVVYDATSLTKKLRANIVSTFRDDASKIICVYFDVSLKECIKRNKKRDKKVPIKIMKNMAKRLEEPEMDEGFDYIVRR